MQIDAARWAQLSPLLDELLELDADARSARLASLALRDRLLADTLAALLDRQGRVDRERFLDGNALGPSGASLAGQAIGAYTLERPLGAGGMGSVWLARRSDGRFEGQVAVKLLNLALLTRGGAERFAREGSLLARLTHPNIARLLDAGVTGGHQPYLVLEYVEGEPIDRWCAARALGVEARVRLLLDVMAAVAHAHSKLVLHRDLKPANILVTRDGQVKLLDFGIAKLLDDEAQAAPATELTQQAGRAFTPDFAAPEQVEGGEVTTATDVYALGVLLYLLLAGAHPTTKPTDTPVERLRSVVETEPRRVSEVAALDGARAGLVGRLRGDLDNICAKALKKSSAERYPTVTALAEDLRRHLADEPVLARPDSIGYRATKFMRRNRVAVGAAAVTLLALVGGIVATTLTALEAQRQRSEALAQRDRAQALLGRNEAIVDFVDIMFSEAVPAGQSAAVRLILERSERLVDSTFAGQPAHQADILRVLASYYTHLHLSDQRAALLARARRIAEGVPDRSLQANLACAHANAISVLGRNEEAGAILDEWIGATDIDAVVAAQCLQMRAGMAQVAADAQAALSYAEAGLQRLRGAGVPAPLLEATLLGDVAFAQHLAGRNAEADRTYQQAHERMRQFGRGEHHDEARMLVSHGVVRYAMSDFNGGLALFQQVLRIYEARADAVISPSILGNRAFGLDQLGRHDEALQAYAQTLDAARRTGHIAGQAYALVGRAAVMAELGQRQPAQASLDEAAPLLRALPPAHSARVRALLVQARLDVLRGDLAAADQRVTSVIELLQRQSATTPPLASAYRQRAEVALDRGERERALADARRALDLARTLQGSNPHSHLTGLASLALGRALLAGGDAAGGREALAAAGRELAQTLGAGHPEARRAARLLAGA